MCCLVLLLISNQSWIDTLILCFCLLVQEKENKNNRRNKKKIKTPRRSFENFKKMATHVLPQHTEQQIHSPDLSFESPHETVKWMTLQLKSYDTHEISPNIPYEETMQEAVTFALKHMDIRFLQMGEMMHAVDATRVAEFALQCSTAASNAREARVLQNDEQLHNLPNFGSKFCPDFEVVMENAKEMTSSKRPYPKRQKDSPRSVFSFFFFESKSPTL